MGTAGSYAWILPFPFAYEWIARPLVADDATRPDLGMRLLVFIFISVLTRVAVAQTADGARRAPGATISGVVSDSIARAPLAGAMVQLVAAEGAARFGLTAVSDSLGRFTLADVPDGRFALGFYHPMLDSLGMDAPLRDVTVEGKRPVRADLAIPSAARLRAAICGERKDSGGVVVGVVRDTRERAPASGVSVIGHWLELTFTPKGIVRRTPRMVVTTRENGFFAMCNVPSGGTMGLIANLGADSTDLIELQVPAEGFVRRDLYVGPSRTIVISDSTPRADSLALPPRRMRLGEGRLNGIVVTTEGARPVPGAQVGIVDGPRTRANDRGEWTLVDAPAGTRMLEIRGVSYYPVRRAVDVVAGAPPVRVTMSTLKSVLDTVRVTASRARTQEFTGFLERQRSGIGRYLTPTDIARRAPMATSDLFRTTPGLHFDRDEFGEKVLQMRGAFGPCAPAIYLDGSHLASISMDDLDGWVRPERIAGIEVYAGGGVPPQFQQGLFDCGSIVIWTK